jgi:uncharacterized protein YjbI with pentapeptide repeats
MGHICAVLTIATLAVVATAEGAIFRWNDGQLIPGTQNITPGPGIRLDQMMLERADLRRFDLTGASFIQSNLHRSDFTLSNLTDANFRGAVVTLCNISFSNLNGADFREANLSEATFHNSTLLGANFEDAIIFGTRFDFTQGFTASQLYSTASYKAKDLTRVAIERVDLTGWNFAGQNMSRMELGGSKLDNADLSHTTLLADLINTSLVGANLRNADLRRAHLSSANVSGADFTDAMVSDAVLVSLDKGTFVEQQLYSTASYKQGNLAGIRLAHNNMRGWNFSQQNLTKAEFLFSDLQNASFLNANLDDADLDVADLRGADFNGASLVRASLSGADLRSADGLHLDATTYVANAIHPDGTIHGIEQFYSLILRDHTFGVTIKDRFELSEYSGLSLEIEDSDWNSTISVDPSVVPLLDGYLSIGFSSEVGQLEDLAGTTFDLFDWNQTLGPTNRFLEIYVPYPTTWDLSKLYDTGEVTLLAVPEPSTWLLLVLACVALAATRRRGWRRRIGLVALAMGLILSAARTSQAGFSVELVDVVPEGPLFRWNYQLIFDTLPGRQRLDAGNGVLAPGVVGSQDFITIYDVGLPSEVSGVTPGPGFTSQVQPVGVDGPSLLLPFDFAHMVNVTYRYVGPPITVSEDTVFTGFSFLHPLGGILPEFFTRVDEYSSQFTDSFGKEANRKISTLGPVLVPTQLIPEPSTWMLLVPACIAVAAVRRRGWRRRSSAAMPAL